MPSTLLLAPLTAFLLASPAWGGCIPPVPSDSSGHASERSSVGTLSNTGFPSPSDGAPSMTTAIRCDGRASATVAPGGKPTLLDGGLKEAKAADAPSHAARLNGAPSLTTTIRCDGRASATVAPGGKPTLLDGGLKEAKAADAPSHAASGAG